MKNILITGHPRSGTQYTYVLLNAMGHGCTYEKRNNNGLTSSWKHIKSGIFEIPCPETNIIFDFDKVLHQTRHPLDVIASSISLWTMSMNYMAKFIDLPDPIINQQNSILNCMITWLEWNKIVEEKASFRYKIESLNNDNPELLNRWCDELEIPRQNIPELRRRVNSRRHEKLTWADLENVDYNKTQEVKKLAEEYGYK